MYCSECQCVCVCRGEYEDGERVQDKAADIRGRKFATGGNCECVCTHVHVLASFPATYMYVEYGVKGHPSQLLYMYVHDCMKYMYVIMFCHSGDKIKRTSRTLQKPNQGIGEYILYATDCTPQTVRHRLYTTDCTPQTVPGSRSCDFISVQEEREDELMKEKRKLSKEVWRWQSL